MGTLLKGFAYIFLLAIIAFAFYLLVRKFLTVCKIDDQVAEPAAIATTVVSAILFYVGGWLGLIVGVLGVLLIVFMSEYRKKKS